MGGVCSSDQEIFLVSKDEDGVFQKPVNGILGMARPDMPYMLAPEVKTPDESTFFLKNLIEEIPSLNYTSFTTNFRDISYPEPSVFGKDQSTFDGAKIAINDDFFWSSWMNGIGYGDDIENLYSFDRANGTIWDEE